MRREKRLETIGQQSKLTSSKSSLASLTPATSSKVMPVLGSIWNLALDLPICMGLLPPPKPPGPPAPPPRRESRNRPPTSSSGKARLPGGAEKGGT